MAIALLATPEQQNAGDAKESGDDENSQRDRIQAVLEQEHHGGRGARRLNHAKRQTHERPANLCLPVKYRWLRSREFSHGVSDAESERGSRKQKPAGIAPSGPCHLNLTALEHLPDRNEADALDNLLTCRA